MTAPNENISNTLHDFSVGESPISHSAQKIDWLTALPERNRANASGNSLVLGSLMVADALALMCSFLFGLALTASIRILFNLQQFSSELTSLPALTSFGVVCSLTVTFSWFYGHYSRAKPVWSEFQELVKILMSSAAVVFAILFLTKLHFSRIWFASFWLCLFVSIPLCRYLVKRILIKNNKWFRPLVVLGGGVNVEKSCRAITSDISLGYQVVERIPLTAGTQADTITRHALSEQILSSINRSCDNYRSPHFLYAPDEFIENQGSNSLLDGLLKSNEQLLISIPIRNLSLSSLDTINVFKNDTMFVRAKNNLKKPLHRTAKRLFDLSVTSIMILLLFPLFALLYFLVRLDGGPAFYGSERMGRYGRVFSCMKFRTMVPDAEARLQDMIEKDESVKALWQSGFKFEDDPRITPVGRFLRRTSLDELPQLFNVLSGQMSLVGPRPILLDETEVYGDHLPLYKQTRPGLTGLWQVSGRSKLSYAERIHYNSWYIRNWSLWLDIIILIKTLPAVVQTADAK